MKPILLLGPAARWRVEVLRLTPADDAAADPAAYSAVIVVDDGDAGIVPRLLTACEMRRGREDLRIGVFSYVDGKGQQSLQGGLAPRLQVELEEEVLRVEYQA